MNMRFTGYGLFGCVMLFIGLGATPMVAAGELEISGNNEFGAGSGFLRGTDCLVLTAEHVIDGTGVRPRVSDRSGAAATGEVIWQSMSPGIDLAVVSFPTGSGVRCGGRWASADWMDAYEFGVGDEFHVLRETRDGSQHLINLKWAGGAPTHLTLSYADEMRLTASDSGSLVMMGKRPAGVVVNVDTERGRVNVLRMDKVESLVGSRFVDADSMLVALEGVVFRGKEHAAWSSYVGTWFGSEGAPPMAEAGHASASCRVTVEVLSFEQTRIANPEIAEARASRANCRSNLLFKNSARLIKMCEDGADTTINNAPRQLAVASIQMRVLVTDSQRRQFTNLGSRQFTRDADAHMSGADVELQVLRETFAALGPPPLQQAGCMKPPSASEKVKKKTGWWKR